MIRHVKTSRTRLCLAVLAIALSAFMVVPAAQAAAATPSSAANALVTGVVVNSTGSAPVKVTFYKWLTMPTTVGATAKWVVVGTTESSPSGDFATNLSSSLIGIGTANITAVLNNNTGFNVWSFHYRIGQRVNSPSLKLDPYGTHGDIGPVCGYPTVYRNLGPQRTQIGQGYILSDGIRQWFTYSHGQSSSLGVGFSASAPTSGFGAQGVMSQSNNGLYKMDFPVQPGDQNSFYYTSFTYTTYALCHGEAGYQTQPTEFAGGSWISHPLPSPVANYCQPQVPGMEVSTNNAQAVNLSGGVNIVKWIGINLSAQTGYSTSAQVTFHFYWPGDLCGTNNYPPEAAQLVAIATGD